MRLSLLTSFLLIRLFAFPQDTAWKTFVIDENMSAYLPVNAIEIDTTLKTIEGLKGSIIFYKAKTGYTSLGITVTQSPSVTKGSSNKVYREVEAGFKESAQEQGYFSYFSDTVLDNITGRKIIIRSSTDQLVSPIMIAYSFLIKNKLYSLVFTPAQPGSDTDIRRLLTGCHFTVNPAEIESAGDEKRYEGVKTKDIFISLGIVVLILGFLMIRYRKKRIKNIYEYKNNQ